LRYEGEFLNGLLNGKVKENIFGKFVEMNYLFGIVVDKNDQESNNNDFRRNEKSYFLPLSSTYIVHSPR